MRQTSAYAWVSETRGTFRGVMNTVERDALVGKSAFDSVIVTDADFEEQEQVWSGAEWVRGKRVGAPVAGQRRDLVAPTEGLWRARMGNPDYPFEFTDGSARPFAVHPDGSVTANALVWGTTAKLESDYVTLPEPTALATPAPRAGQLTTGGVVGQTSITVNWPSTPVAGNLLICAIAYRPVGTGGAMPAVGPPAGFSEAQPSVDSGVRIYYKIANGTETSAVFDFLGTSCDARMTLDEYTGIAAAPYDVGEPQGLTSPRTIHTTDISPPTTQPSELWLGIIGVREALTQSFSQSNGFIHRASGISGNLSHFVAHRIATSTGTAGFETSTVSPGAGAGYIATFKAAPAAIAAPGADKARIFAFPVGLRTSVAAKDSNDIKLDLTAGAILAHSTTMVTVENTTTRTPFFSYTVPAGLIQGGTVVEIDVWGTIDSQAASGTLTFELFHNSSDIGSGWVLASVTNARSLRYFHIHYHHQLSTASGGLQSSEGFWSMLSDWPTGGADRTQIDFASDFYNFDTVNRTIEFMATWAVASASNMLKARGYTVRLYR